MKFFQSVTTLEELKKQYRKLALKHHPDRGGNEQDFIELKAEYDRLFKRLNEGEAVADTYKNIIDSLINYDLEIEIIGSWVWVTGNTFPIKQKLKELGFQWASKKKAWYWYEGEYQRKHRQQYTLDEIRQMHQVKKVKSYSNRLVLEA